MFQVKLEEQIQLTNGDHGQDGLYEVEPGLVRPDDRSSGDGDCRPGGRRLGCGVCPVRVGDYGGGRN